MKLRLPDLIRKPFYFQEIFGSIILKGRHSGENGNPNPIERQISKSLPILKMPHPIIQHFLNNLFNAVIH